jgi:hypothetical protein
MDNYTFRCFEKREKFWIFKNMPLSSNEFPEYVKMIYSSDPERYALDSWTGVVDKNGTPIYRNDFVRAGDKLYMVYFDGLEFVLECLVGEPDDTINFEECECIGNLYENPELYEKAIIQGAEEIN